MLKVYRSEQGSALVLVICSIAVLSVLVTAMMKLSISSYEAASTKEKASQALGLAEAGVSHALSEINKASSILEVPRKINNLTGNLSIDGQDVGHYQLYNLTPPAENKVGFKMLGEDKNSIRKVVELEVEFKPAPAPGTNFLTLFQYPVASFGSISIGGSASIEGYPQGYVPGHMKNVSGIPTDTEIKAIVEKFSELATWSNIGNANLQSLSTVPNPDPYPVYYNKGNLILQGSGPFGVNGKGIIAVDGDVQLKSDIGTGINDEIVVFATGKLTINPPGNNIGKVLVLASEIFLGGSGTYDFDGSLVTNNWSGPTNGNIQFKHNLNLNDKFKVVFNTHFNNALTKPEVVVLRWDEIN